MHGYDGRDDINAVEKGDGVYEVAERMGVSCDGLQISEYGVSGAGGKWEGQ
jgi:hypothetical protein